MNISYLLATLDEAYDKKNSHLNHCFQVHTAASVPTWWVRRFRLDSAGINRHGVANERVVQGRRSEPPWPRAM